MVLRFLLEKEFKQLRRNPIMIGVLIFYTALMLFVFPWTINQDIKQLRVTIVNNDTGSYSHRLISKMQASSTFVVEDIVPYYPLAIKNIEEQKSLAVVVIPKDFSKDLVTNSNANLQVQINAVDGSQAGLAESYIHQLVEEFSHELSAEVSGLTEEQLTPVAIHPTYKYNPSLNYMYFMLPGLLVIMLTMYSSIFAAMSIVTEKELGTIQQINVTPIRRHIFILAKIIPFWVIALLVTCVSVPLIYWLYGLTFSGNFVLYLFAVLLFAVALSFMGVILSNMSETLQQAMFLILFFILIFFLLSGLFSPVDAMPVWAQFIAYSNPLTYFIRLTRMMYLRGAGLVEIYPDLLAIVGFLIVFALLAIATQKKRSS